MARRKKIRLHDSSWGAFNDWTCKSCRKPQKKGTHPVYDDELPGYICSECANRIEAETGCGRAVIS